MGKEYKTLFTFGGVQYISLAEHEEIVNSVINFDSAVQTVRETLNTLTSAVKSTKNTVESAGI